MAGGEVVNRWQKCKVNSGWQSTRDLEQKIIPAQIISAQIENKVQVGVVLSCLSLFIEHRHHTGSVYGDLRITSNTITTLYKQTLQAVLYRRTAFVMMIIQIMQSNGLNVWMGLSVAFLPS